MHARSSSTDSPHKLFIIVREGLADVEARRARTICPPFIPTTGCRHLPVLTTLPVPTRPRRAQKTAARIFPSKAQALLGEAGLLRDIWEGITTQADYDIHHDCVDVDALLLAGWNRHAPARPTSPFEEPAKPSQESIALHQQETIHLVRRLWQLRAGLRMDARQASHADGAPTLSRLWQGWRTACQLQQLQTKLRKRGRLKKTHMVEMAVKADNIYQAARRFAPKTRKQRLQLRSAEGQLQTPEAEFTDIVQYFSELYGGALPTDPDVLEAPLDITWEEVAFAIHKLSPGKSMPSYSPPAALWKALRHQLAPVITKQLAIVFQPGVLLLPRAWCISELVLLPKPGKALTSASQLRPICLLPPTAKVLATSLATRLLPYAQEYLKQVPQFAYTAGRSLQQALERVFAHCSEVRSLVAQQNGDLFAKRQGRERRAIVGGIQLSLDISKAYDSVERADLKAALQDAAVPLDLTAAIMAIHNQACLNIQHGGSTEILALRKGLRQGCGLSPILWAIYSGWVLRRLEQQGQVQVTKAGTAFADDLHFSWLVCSGAALENAYRSVKAVLVHLAEHRLQVSTAKTVILVELKGPKAAGILRKYLVEKKQGTYMRFRIDHQNIDIKVVAQHVYLGACVSYRKFEQETVRRRIQLAHAQFARLRSILKCKAVAQKLRMQLWQACVPPCLLHGLDCSGLPLAEAKQITTLLIQQARLVAQSHSMLTRETNQQFMYRMKLPHPVDVLLKAVTSRAYMDEELGDAIRPNQAQLQRRSMLRAHLADADILKSRSTPPSLSPARLIPVDKVVEEVFECEHCGQQFAMAAAQKRHEYLVHMTEGDQEARQLDVRSHSVQAPMEHSQDGMPWRRHCQRKFHNWPNFYYHINARSCEGLRRFYEQSQPALELAQMSCALVEKQDVLEFAKDCTWLELAALPAVSRNVQHCPECHHWVATPQYLKRHMKAKHPSLAALVDACTEFVKTSNVSIASPCKYCNIPFQRRDAHLRSCAGLFCGAYVYSRIARGKPLPLNRHGTHGDRCSRRACRRRLTSCS